MNKSKLLILLSLVLLTSMVLFACGGSGATSSNKATVIFNTDGGDQVEEQEVEIGGFVTEPREPGNANLKFDGWYKESTFETKWNFYKDTVEGSMTLYAKFLDEVTVKLMANDETQIQLKKVVAGEKVDLSDITPPVSFTITGWYTDVDLTEEFDLDTAITKNITLYAGLRLIEDWIFDGTASGWTFGEGTLGGTVSAGVDGGTRFTFNLNANADSHIRFDGTDIDITDSSKWQINIEYKNFGKCTDVRIYYATSVNGGVFASYTQKTVLRTGAMFNGDWQVASLNLAYETLANGDQERVTDYDGQLLTLRIDFPTENPSNAIEINRIWFSAID